LMRQDFHEDLPAFYFLNDSMEIADVVAFKNPTPADRWAPLPTPDYLSPVAIYRRFFAEQLDRSEYLCGPWMSYRKGAVVKHFPFEFDGSSKLKRLADGTWLIREGLTISGPYHMGLLLFGMRIFALTPSLEMHAALQIGAGTDIVLDYGVEMSDDWRRVTEFRRTFDGDKWTSETFCLTGVTYRSCGKNADSPPPGKGALTP